MQSPNASREAGLCKAKLQQLRVIVAILHALVVATVSKQPARLPPTFLAAQLTELCNTPCPTMSGQSPCSSTVPT